MTEHKFTIVIPTRNRADTLYWCLKTCVEQQYPNFEIIVSNNNSEDNTEEVVASFNDTRIRYYHTGASLSMSANWEFALDKVDGGFVSFIGDDDGLMPNALRLANEYINRFNVEAVIGRKDLYKWNNINEIRQRGLLRYEVNRKTKIIDAGKQLEIVLNKTFDYTKLPCIYDTGFIAVDVINRIKARTGNVFFHSSIPDIYSSIAITSELKHYLYANESFFLAGLSSRSNGNSFYNPKTDKSIINSFVAENTIPFHPDLDFNASMAATLAESLFQVRDAGIDLPCTLSIRRIAELAIEEASYGKFKETYNAIKKSVEHIIKKNETSLDYYYYLVKKYPYKSWLRRNLKAYLDLFDPDKTQNIAQLQKKADNIYSATFLNYAIKKNGYLRNNPFVIFFKWMSLYRNRKS